jgi:hypothetical protein
MHFSDSRYGWYQFTFIFFLKFQNFIFAYMKHMFNVKFRAMLYNNGEIFSLGYTLVFVVVLWFYMHDVSNT